MLTDEEILTIFQQHDDETDAGAITIGRAIEQAAIAAHSAKSHDAWKLAVDDELVTIGSTADSFDSPKAAIAELIDWHVSAALDPAIAEIERSRRVQNLIDKGRVSAGAQEPAAYMWRDGGAWELTFDVPPPTATKSVPLYAHPQPMTQTAAARDALAEIITARKAMLKRIDDVHTADRQTGCNTFYDNDLERHTAILFRAIDAEIERIEREGEA